VRHAQRRGRGPSSSTRLRERRCSQSERREAADGCREQEAGVSRRAQRPRAVEQHQAAREALLTERAARGSEGRREQEAARDAPRSE